MTAAQRPDAPGDLKAPTGSIPRIAAYPRGAEDHEPWMNRQKPYDGPKLAQPQSMIYTSGTTGGRRACAASPDARTAAPKGPRRSRKYWGLVADPSIAL